MGSRLLHCSLLLACGYRYGGTILNFPEQVAAEVTRRSNLRESQPDLRPSDLILLPTRPPLDDDINEGSKRLILRSEQPLEKDVLRCLRAVLQKCDRETIRLADSVRLVENSWLHEVHFYQSKGGNVRYYDVNGRRQSPANRNITVGYVISVPHIQPSMPRLLAAFGAGGTETLLFSFLLRNDHKLSSTLRTIVSSKQVRLLVCTFQTPASIPYPFLNYDP
jgi:hypothetical protein